MISGETIDHDRLFKELLSAFFHEFLELFFPKLNRLIDPGSFNFLQQELFSDITVGEKHVVDLLVETRLQGTKGIILIHIEHQARSEKDFSERMFIYFSRLWQKFRCPILPVAIFSQEEESVQDGILEMKLPVLEVLRFAYYPVVLKNLDWREYLQQDNPVAAALLSKMGYRSEERVWVKLEFLKILTRLQLNLAEKALLTGFFETYLQLNKEEEKEFKEARKELSPEEVQELEKIETSWHKKGREEGRQEGHREGRLEIIEEFARKKYGQFSADIKEELQKLSCEQLKGITHALFDGISWEEFAKMVQEKSNKD